VQRDGVSVRHLANDKAGGKIRVSHEVPAHWIAITPHRCAAKRERAHQWDW